MGKSDKPKKAKPGRRALLGGLLLGTLAGIFFAPEEGKKFRKKIADRDLKGITQNLSKMGEELKDLVAAVAKRPSVVEAVEKAKDKAKQFLEENKKLDALLDEAKEKAQRFTHGVKEYVEKEKKVLKETFGDLMQKAPQSKSVAKKKATPKKKPTPKPVAKPAPKAAPAVKSKKPAPKSKKKAKK